MALTKCLRKGTSHPKNTKIFLLALSLSALKSSVSSELSSLRLIVFLKILLQMHKPKTMRTVGNTLKTGTRNQNAIV